MQKPLELNGAAAHLNYPLRLRWYEPHLVPDAIAMAGCVIGINSSQSGELGRIAIAINSSWKTLKFADEGDAAPVIVQQTAPQTVDVEPVLRRVVGEMLPALIPQTPVPALPARPDNPDSHHAAPAGQRHRAYACGTGPMWRHPRCRALISVAPDRRGNCDVQYSLKPIIALQYLCNARRDYLFGIIR